MSKERHADQDAEPSDAKHAMFHARDSDLHFGVGPGDLPRASYFRFLSTGSFTWDEGLPACAPGTLPKAA